jgi:signal transduction histidine kinase
MTDSPLPVQGAIRAQQIIAISRMTPATMVACIATAIAAVFVLSLERYASPTVLIWAAVAISFSCFVLWKWYGNSKKPTPETLSKRTARKSVVFALIVAGIWSFPSLFFLPQSAGIPQAFLIAQASGVIAVGAIMLYPLPTAAMTFCGMVSACSLVGLYLTGQPQMLSFGIVLIALFGVITQSVIRSNEAFTAEFMSRRELITQNALIEELLAETREEVLEQRMAAERRAIQSQKMDAIGQLTAGVAHDFNNLLAAIHGNAELLALEGADRDLVNPILSASQRGADLTKRLLAFARQQDLAPRPVDMQVLVSDMTQLLRNTLGEEIAVAVNFDNALWPVLVDPGPLEGAILNLALNAREAMPNGGGITIECYNEPAHSGFASGQRDAVVFRITDTGKGMGPIEQSRAAEPFYTSKKFGKGRGLGLSMVYGFIEQSHGHMTIDSAPGLGSSISLFLPVSPTAPESQDASTDSTAPTGDGVPILIVEDNDAVRTTLVATLRSLNYSVQEARSVKEAETILAEPRSPEIVLSDIILPGGRNGFEFAQNLALTAPSTKVFLMSGHPLEGGIESAPDSGVYVLPKPFCRQQLAEHLHSGRPFRGVTPFAAINQAPKSTPQRFLS